MRRIVVLVGVFALLLTAAVPGGAQVGIERTDRPLPESIENLRLDTPITASPTGIAKMDPSLAGSAGDRQVIIRLSGASLAESGVSNGNAQAQHVANVKSTQDSLLSTIRSLDPGARLLGSTQRVINAVFVSVDASVLAEIASDPRVSRVAPVANYQLDLDETVPYIGADEVQASGYDGSGVTVAVLDSGIDYLHAKLGGSGSVDEFNANDPITIEAGSFPTAKVVAGHDFVGETWQGGTDIIEPDPDPLDKGAGAGHGTHVADIIAGSNGVAPGADLVAVKVCSAISTSCSGVALILGMEFAVDPNGDGRPNDRVDIINMSLGSNYGQPFDDDLSVAVDGATALGVLTVASSGNAGDLPFVTGSPAAAATALSVAQTQVPSATEIPMQIVTPESAAGFYPAVFQPWSKPQTAAISGPVTYGDGAGGNLLGCDPFVGGSLAGQIVAVDRGTCDFSLKIQNIEAAGGILGIIITVGGAAPFPGGFGSGDLPQIPAYMILDSHGNPLRTAPGDEAAFVNFDPALGTPLIGTMVGSSSRGPQFDDLRIKPEIGAPGASISAETGTGTGQTPFGGTSGAAPMVSGAAALVIQATGGNQSTGRGTAAGRGLGLKPLELKALLMNNADPDIRVGPNAALAEVTRIGGGEVRANQATTAPVVAYDAAGFSGGLSFGFHDVAEPITLTRTVTIRNLESSNRTYTITPTFRGSGDGNGAVTVSAPASVQVRPGTGRTASFDVTLTIDPNLLGANALNSGANGANPAALTAMEYDGYLVLESGDDTLRIPWHVLPRKSARVEAERLTLETGGFPEVIGLTNTGAGVAQNDAYALVATDESAPEGGRGEQSPTPDIAAVGVNTFPVPAGFCSAEASFLWVFAVSHHDRQTHAIAPGIAWIDLDVDQDGTPDYAVYTYSLAGLGSIADGRVVTWTAPYVDFDAGLIGPQDAFFFAEHSTVTGNTVLIICGEQIGMNAADILTTTVDAKAYAFDIYFGGPGDETDPFTITPLGERFFGSPEDIGPDSSGTLAVYDFGAFPGNTDELGVLLVTNGDRGAGNRGAATEATEALTFLVP
jgi:subtilisin family serine protease